MQKFHSGQILHQLTCRSSAAGTLLPPADFRRKRNSRPISAAIVRATYLLLAVIVVLLCWHQIIDVDLWWHLRTGELILKTQSIPRTDPFSHTSAGSLWIDLHWLYQVLLYATFKVGGAAGIMILKTSILTAAFAIVTGLYSRRFTSVSGVLLSLLGLLAFERYFPRPEIMSFLFCAIYLWILDRHQRGKRSPLILLPILQILWTNIEGLFVLGLVLIAAFAAGEVLQAIFSRHYHRHTPQAATSPLRLVAVLFASTAATLLNPYGIQGSLFPLTLYSRLGAGTEIFSSTITELRPPPLALFWGLHWPLWFFNCLLVISACSFLLNVRRVRLGWLIAYAAFLFLAIRARRNIPLFIAVALPVTMRNLCEVGSLVRHCNAVRYLRALLIPVIVVVCLFAVLAIPSNYYSSRYLPLSRFGMGFSPYMYPEGACRFVERMGLRGKMFNNIGIGGYLIWRLYPEHEVFIDGRLEVHGRRFYTEYITAMQRPRYWPLLAEKYGIQFVILQYTMADTLPLVRALHESDQWSLVYLDSTSLVFVRKDGSNAAVAQALAPRIAARLGELNRKPASLPRIEQTARAGPTLPLDRVHRGALLASLRLYNAAIREFSCALKDNPGVFQALYDLALVLSERGQFEAALPYARAAATIRDHSGCALDALAFIQWKLGRISDAEKLLNKSLRVDPLYVKSYYDLAAIYLKSGKYDLCSRLLVRTLKRYPQVPELRRLLSLCRLQQEELEQAFTEAQAAVAIDPYCAAGYELLGYTLSRLGRYAEARQAYSIGLTLDPSNVGMRVNMGLCCLRMGDLQEAHRYWEEALTLQPTNMGIRHNLNNLKGLLISKETEQ